MIHFTKEKDGTPTGAAYKYTAEDGRIVVEYDRIFKKWFVYVLGEYVGSGKTYGEAIRNGLID